MLPTVQVPLGRTAKGTSMTIKATPHESIHVGYLHELAEQIARTQRPSIERRREEGAKLRAEIDDIMAVLEPATERERLIILRSYHVGLKRGNALMPRL